MQVIVTDKLTRKFGDLIVVAAAFAATDILVCHLSLVSFNREEMPISWK